MENLEIAGVLEDVADLLEIQGTNPFRIRAYRNAARTVKELTHSLAGMVEEGEDLTELPGIGKDMAAHIEEAVRTHRLGLLERLEKEVPLTLLQLIRLEGVGPTKARRLWRELGITSVEELEKAARDGRVAALDGFGARSVAKLLGAVASFEKMRGRYLLSEADAALAPLLAYAEGLEEVARSAVAGSYRRRTETVEDVELLLVPGSSPDARAQTAADATSGPVADATSGPPADASSGPAANASSGPPADASSGPAANAASNAPSRVPNDVPPSIARVLERVSAFPGVVRVEELEPQSARLVLASGLPVNVRIVPRESFGAALYASTGAAAHVEAVQDLARGGGLRMDERGVFRTNGGDEDARLGGEEEADVYEALGLPWISPLLREGRGELEAARRNGLPRLVSVSDIRGDLQMHSTWSDGKNTIREMAEACRARGYAYLSLTDHSQAVSVAGGLKPDDVRAQWDEIEEVRATVEGVRLYRSLEVDILKDGTLDMPDDVLAELDLVLVSVHSFMGLGQAEMTERVLRALDHPEVDILAHPTGRILTRREPYALDVEAVLEAAADRNVAVELNAHPSRLDLDDRYVRKAKQLGVKVVINTDAHSVRDLDYMRYGVDQAGRGWLERDDVLNTLSPEAFENWRRRREHQREK